MWKVTQYRQQRNPPALIGGQMVKYENKQESCSEKGEGGSRTLILGTFRNKSGLM